MKDYSVIGKSIPKVDAIAKATVEARFVPDIYLKDMLWAKVLRSTKPHARIRSINTTKAKSLRGVRAVITAEDVPDARYGTLVLYMGIFARGKVRYIGEAVAAVAAIDEDTAYEALELIEVEYEELPSVFDPLQSMLPEAPILHEDLKSYTTLFFRTDKSMTGNVNYQAVIRQGDIEKGFARSDEIFEDTFTTQKVLPSFLEPNSTVAALDQDGRLIIYNTTQRPHVNQAILSSLLGIPISKIRVIPCHVGGGFGGKNRTLSEPAAAALALKTRAPVCLVFSMEEEFTSATTRHSTVIQIKTGVKKDGTLVASEMKLIYDCGAYASTPNAVWLGAITASGPYRILHFSLEAFSVYTNKVMSGAFRGYGTPQVTFARESQMDRIAHELNIDPVEMRLKNCLKKGDSLVTGQPLVSVNIKETILQAAKKIDWGKSREGKHRALGISCGFTPCGGFATSSIVRMNQDGTAIVSTGAMDMGQGLKTVMAQIVAEELGLGPDDITVISGDTDLSPFDVGIFGDRGTHTSGMAVKMAASDAKKQMLHLAAEQLDANVEDLEMKEKKVHVKGGPDRFIRFKDILGGSMYKKGGPVIGKASINPEAAEMDPRTVQGAASRFFSTYTFATNIVEIEIVPESGEISVLRAVASNDCGTVINPNGAEGQVDGGMATGLGYGLYEEVHIRDGQVLNPSFLEYKIPTALDMPAFSRVIVENYDDNGPFGAKGIGNSSVVNMAPAIANAVFTLTGIRLRELPVLPEKIQNEKATSIKK
ncbi:MAG: xanthine dehydrogenase family protein molybdopterin-binding subunit [Syntrophorhabdales bacterium]|jgi:CO/xanthine dehydrogenase Mo-binding subunit